MLPNHSMYIILNNNNHNISVRLVCKCYFWANNIFSFKYWDYDQMFYWHLPKADLISRVCTKMCNLIFDQFTVSNKAKQIWLHITIWQLSEYIDILQNILGHSFPNHIYIYIYLIWFIYITFLIIVISFVVLLYFN